MIIRAKEKKKEEEKNDLGNYVKFKHATQTKRSLSKIDS
jgi:hypothetical protein